MGIVLLHPGEDLADLTPVLFELALLLRKLVMVPGDDLPQIADETGYRADITSETVKASTHYVKASSHLGESSCRISRVFAEDPSEPLKGQAVRWVSHLSRPL
jgi:hypothetical protein